MKTSTHSIVVLIATILALGLSGCTDSKSEPQPTTSQPVVVAPTTSAPSEPVVPEPPAREPAGLAHLGNYTYKSDSNIPQATFKVTKNWQTLDFRVQMWKNAQCGLLQAEPPAGTGTGPQPQVSFTSPSGAKVGPIELGTYSSCDVNANNKVGSTPPNAVGLNEVGDWKIDIHGRGLNVYVQVTVRGE